MDGSTISFSSSYRPVTNGLKVVKPGSNSIEYAIVSAVIYMKEKGEMPPLSINLEL
jgi:hypothetical protein